MSTYLFKNASKGKAPAVSPNKLAKFITNPTSSKRHVTDRKIIGGG
jgi:hypothetical protein